MAGQLVPAKPINLVAAQSEFAVGRHHLRVQPRAGQIAFRIVLFAVDLEDDPLVPWQQQKEIHPLPQQRLAIDNAARNLRDRSANRPAE